MSYGFSKTSGLKAMYLEGKDPDYTSNTDIKFKYDKTQIPAGFGVSSSDDITFNLSQGSSYVLLANIYWIHTSRYGDMMFSFGFYNDDTSSYIGTPGGVVLESNFDTDPLYPKMASLVVLGSTIPVTGTNISVRFKEVTAPLNDNWLDPSLNRTTGDFEGQNIFSTRPITVMPTLTIIKTDN
jgi:hypothetical protein